MIKKWICFGLMFLMLLTSMPVHASFTEFDFSETASQEEQVTSGHVEVQYVNRNGFTSLRSAIGVSPGEADATVGALSSEDSQVLEEQGSLLRKYMVARTPVITLSFPIYGSIDANQLHTLLLEIALRETGNGSEGDYLSFHWSNVQSQTGWQGDGTKTTYTVTYTIDYRTNATQEAQLTKALNSLYASLGLKKLSNPYKKLVLIYDYIIENIVYDDEHYPQGANYPLQYTAYAALIDKTALCQGYSLLLYRMLLDNNIPARCIRGTSDGQPHMWNLVKLGEAYYNCDSTWDASDLGHSYFLKGSKSFDSNHIRSQEYTGEAFLTSYPTSKTDYKETTPTPTPKPTKTPAPTVTPTITPTPTPASSRKYPTAKLLSKTTQSVKRGKTVKLKFKLKSGSYTQKGDIYRAEFDVRIYNSSGKMVAWNGADGLYYTGTLKHTIKWKVPEDLPVGKYTVNFRTYYNKLKTGYKWYYNKKTTNATCYVKVK